MFEAESQEVLNTLIEHDFQIAFKKWQYPSNGAYAQKETTSRVMVASRPKVSFYQSWKLWMCILRNCQELKYPLANLVVASFFFVN
jgi:hypothetical protein